MTKGQPSLFSLHLHFDGFWQNVHKSLSVLAGRLPDVSPNILLWLVLRVHVENAR
jgi:hypothetical protein